MREDDHSDFVSFLDELWKVTANGWILQSAESESEYSSHRFRGVWIILKLQC